MPWAVDSMPRKLRLVIDAITIRITRSDCSRHDMTKKINNSVWRFVYFGESMTSLQLYANQRLRDRQRRNLRTSDELEEDIIVKDERIEKLEQTVESLNQRNKELVESLVSSDRFHTEHLKSLKNELNIAFDATMQLKQEFDDFAKQVVDLKTKAKNNETDLIISKNKILKSWQKENPSYNMVLKLCKTCKNNRKQSLDCIQEIIKEIKDCIDMKFLDKAEKERLLDLQRFCQSYVKNKTNCNYYKKLYMELKPPC